MAEEDKLRENRWILWTKRVVYGSALVFPVALSIFSYLYSSEGYTLAMNTVGRMVMEILLGILAVAACWMVACVVEKIPKPWGAAGGIFLFCL